MSHTITRQEPQPFLPAPERLDVPARHAWRALLHTRSDPAPFVLRIVLAVVMFAHGAQHLPGWFGGFGFAGTYGWMTTTLGIPGALAASAIVLEFIAPLALFVGVGGRIAAAALGAILAVAAVTHLEHGFFMNWLGDKGGEGFELHLLGMAMAAAVVLKGSGAWSLDRWLTREERS